MRYSRVQSKNGCAVNLDLTEHMARTVFHTGDQTKCGNIVDGVRRQHSRSSDTVDINSHGISTPWPKTAAVSLIYFVVFS